MAAVTVCVLSLVMTLPNGSSSLTTGWVVNAAPAVAAGDGCWVTTSLLAAAGLTTTPAEVGAVRCRWNEVERDGLGLVVAQVVKVAIPPTASR